MAQPLQVFAIEGRGKSLRPGWNASAWRVVDVEVGRNDAVRRRKIWAEDYPQRDFRVRKYIPVEDVELARKEAQ
jgi:hypothetical protein